MDQRFYCREERGEFEWAKLLELHFNLHVFGFTLSGGYAIFFKAKQKEESRIKMGANMIRINQIKLKAGPELAEREGELLKSKIQRLLKLKGKGEFTYEIVKRSLDARKKPEIFYIYTVDVKGLKEDEVQKRIKGNQISVVESARYRFPSPGGEKMAHRPVIIGTGPAGLFCGYMLALHGYRPVLLERGMDVERRCGRVEEFWKTGRLDKECNIQFGEGGAGTFSDGKLNTLVKDKDGRSREVLSIFAASGAPQTILYDGKPHIGTDILTDVVRNMRKTIISHGGEVHFNTKVTDFYIEDGRITALEVEKRAEGEERGNRTRIDTDVAVLAIGHSARDTFERLYQRKVPMEAKSFAVGLRAEHPQKLVDSAQYGMERPQYLPPASYKVTARAKNGRGVYSFCMCPGGYVVNASSEEGRLAVNGMSYSGRDGRNANSAIIVSVTPEDYGSSHPLGGIEFQRKLEERAYEIGNGKVPVEYYGDFKRAVWGGGEDKDYDGTYGKSLPQIKGEWQFGKVHHIMPEGLNRAFVEGMEAFGRKIPGFGADGVILSGIESRTSSPVRIRRGENGQSEIGGLYPCGEGAGYAGGIMSAAMDGIRTAEQIARKYQKKRANEEEKEYGWL